MSEGLIGGAIQRVKDQAMPSKPDTRLSAGEQAKGLIEAFNPLSQIKNENDVHDGNVGKLQKRQLKRQALNASMVSARRNSQTNSDNYAQRMQADAQKSKNADEASRSAPPAPKKRAQPGG